MGCSHEGEELQDALEERSSSNGSSRGSEVAATRGKEAKRRGKVPGPVIMMSAEAAVLGAALLPWLPCSDGHPHDGTKGAVDVEVASDAAERSGDSKETAGIEAGAPTDAAAAAATDTPAGTAESGTSAAGSLPKAGVSRLRSPRTRLARVLATALSSARATVPCVPMLASPPPSSPPSASSSWGACGPVAHGHVALPCWMKQCRWLSRLQARRRAGWLQGRRARRGSRRRRKVWMRLLPGVVMIVKVPLMLLSTVLLSPPGTEWMATVVALTTSVDAASSTTSTVRAPAGVTGTAGPAGEETAEGGGGAMEGEEVRAPAYTFELDGESSGLLGPGDSKWPFASGYAFATWIYVESFYDTESSAVGAAAMAAAIAAAATAKVGRTSAVSAAAAASALAGEGLMHMPRLYSFLTAESQGVEAYFHREYLIRWYFIGLEHVFKPSLLGKAECEIRLFVDGRLIESLPLDLPRISRPLGFLCIGTNPPAAMAGLQRRRKQCPLFAELGPVYIFKEPIGAERMMRLAARGGDHLPCFGAGAGVPALLSSDQLMLAADDAYSLDSDLAPRLHLLYHPRLLLGRFCPDASPASAAGVHRRPAEVLGHVHVAARHRVPEVIWQAGQGGPLALLTLCINAIQPDSFLPQSLALSADPLAAVAAARLLPRVLGLVGRAMRHGMNREEMKGGAPAMLAHMVAYGLSTCAQGATGAGKGDGAKVGCRDGVGSHGDGTATDKEQREQREQQVVTAHPRGEPYDKQLVTAAAALAMAPRFGDPLKPHLFLHLLLHLPLWASCPLPVQQQVLSSLAAVAVREQHTLRAAGALPVLLDGCRRCYWVQHEAISLPLGPASSRSVTAAAAGSHGAAEGSGQRSGEAKGDEQQQQEEGEVVGAQHARMGEVNALVDAVVGVLELLLASSSSAAMGADMRTLVAFLLDCPHPNQVVRVLLLVYRLMAHPNAARAAAFSVQFLAAGGAQMLLALLLRESQWGDVREVMAERSGGAKDSALQGGVEGSAGPVVEAGEGASMGEGSVEAVATGGGGAVVGGASVAPDGAPSAPEAAGTATAATAEAEAAATGSTTTSRALSPKAPTPKPSTPAASTPSWQAFFDPFGLRGEAPEAEAQAVDGQRGAAGSGRQEGGKETAAGGKNGEMLKAAEAGEAVEAKEEPVLEPRTGLDVAAEIIKKLQERGLFQASDMCALAPGPTGNTVSVARSVSIRQPLASSRAAGAKGSHGLSTDVITAAAALSLSGSGRRSGRRLTSSPFGDQTLLAPKSHDFPLTDGPDGIFLAVVAILGLLAEGGYIRLSSPAVLGLVPGGPGAGLGSVVADRGAGDRNNVGAWAVYGVQRALQLAPSRLLTPAVYHALMTAVLRSESATSVQGAGDSGITYRGGSSSTSAGPAATRAEAAAAEAAAAVAARAAAEGASVLPADTAFAASQLQLLLALLRALPAAPPRTQLAILQDVLLLVSVSGSNRRQLSCIPEWPEWLLETLLDNLERLPAGACSISSTQGGVQGQQRVGGEEGQQEKGEGTHTAAGAGSAEGVGAEVVDAEGEGHEEVDSGDGDGDGSGGEVTGEQGERVAVNEMIFTFLGTVLEHCMTFKDGWKELEATFHCLEWMALIGGSSIGPERVKREAGMATVKRRLLHGVMDFTAAQLTVQAQVEAAAAAAAAAAAEAAALSSPLPVDIPISPTPSSPHPRSPDPLLVSATSACLLENAVALLMLLEDFLRIHAAARSPLPLATLAFDADDTLPGSRPAAWQEAPAGSPTPASAAAALPGTTATAAAAAAAGLKPLAAQLSNPLLSSGSSSRRRSPTDLITLEMLGLMADDTGQLTPAMLDRITASTSAEPFEGVRCALPTYGSISQELPLSWGHRSKLWYGVALPPEGKGGPGWGGGRAAWAAAVEMDPVTGRWQDLPLVVKAVGILRSMLLEEGEVAQGGEGGGGGGESGAGEGGKTQGGKAGGGAAEGVLAVVGGIANMLGGGSPGGVLNRASQRLLEDDQTLLTVLRLAAVAARELSDVVDEGGEGGEGGREDSGVGERAAGAGGVAGGGLVKRGEGGAVALERAELEGISPGVLSSLLWRVVLPLLTTASLDARKQCALATSAVLHTEAIHAIAPSRTILRPSLIAVLLPPLAALLRKWRPAFAFIAELTDFEGHNPFLRDHDRALATDAAAEEASLALLQVIWVAAFASPPASTALAAMAAAAGPGSTALPTPLTSSSSSSSLTNLSSAPVSRTSTHPSATTPTGSTALAATASSFSGTSSGTVGTVHRTSSHHVPPSQHSSSSAVNRRPSARRSGVTKGGGGRQEGEREGATSSQRRMNGDKDRAQRWSLGEAMEKAWDCSHGIPVSPATRSSAAAAGGGGGGGEGREGGVGASGSDDTLNAMALGPTLGGLQQHLDGMRGLIRAQRLRRVKIETQMARAHTAGMRMWRSLVRQLLESGLLVGLPGSYQELKQRKVFWKVDRVESGSRMRRRMVRNYGGSDCHGLAADFRDEHEMDAIRRARGDEGAGDAAEAKGEEGQRAQEGGGGETRVEVGGEPASVGAVGEKVEGGGEGVEAAEGEGAGAVSADGEGGGKEDGQEGAVEKSSAGEGDGSAGDGAGRGGVDEAGGAIVEDASGLLGGCLPAPVKDFDAPAEVREDEEEQEGEEEREGGAGVEGAGEDRGKGGDGNTTQEVEVAAEGDAEGVKAAGEVKGGGMAAEHEALKGGAHLTASEPGADGPGRPDTLEAKGAESEERDGGEVKQADGGGVRQAAEPTGQAASASAAPSEPLSTTTPSATSAIASLAAAAPAAPAAPTTSAPTAAAAPPAALAVSAVAAVAAAAGEQPGLSAVVGGSEVAAEVAVGERERVMVEVPAMMVLPLQVVTGRLLVTASRLLFLVDPSVTFRESGADEQRKGGSERREGGGEEEEEGVGGKKARDRVWRLTSVREVLSRRYLLRRSALEIFMIDRSNFFFNFEGPEERLRVHRAIEHANPPHLQHHFLPTQRPEKMLERLQLTERWLRREITNFDYLMQLNTLAGRTFNDVTQYPVFPWVIQDYTSKELDLTNPATFRDLSKPVGALDAARLEKFIERYHSFADPIIPKFHYGSHYSSAGIVAHYLLRVEPYTSLALALQGGQFDHPDRLFLDVAATWRGVTSDMSDVKELIPEWFCLPEMFCNVNGLHLGSTQKGEVIGDVKLPPWAASAADFVRKQRAALESEYVSSNLHHWIDLIFGYKQKGKEALNAHNVFFYVTYEGAVDIDSITNPIVRRGMQDQISYFGQTPSQLLTTPHPQRIPLDFALHLHTVFRKPDEILPYVLPNPDTLNVPASRIVATSDSIVTVDLNAPACHVAVHQWQPNTPDGHGWPFLFQPGRSSLTGSAILRMLTGAALGSKGSNSETSLYPRLVALPAPGVKHTSSAAGTVGMGGEGGGGGGKEIIAISPDGKFLFTGGHADFSVKLVSVDSTRVLETAAVHAGPVTCLALSPDGATLATGATDGVVLLWRVNQASAPFTASPAAGVTAGLVAAGGGGGGRLARRSTAAPTGPHDPALAAAAAAVSASEERAGSVAVGGADYQDRGAGGGMSEAALLLSAAGGMGMGGGLEAPRKWRRMEGPVQVLRGHLDDLLCCAVSSDLDLVASSSRSRGVILHSLMKGRFLRQLPGVGPADVLAISPEGVVVVWERQPRTLRAFTINGGAVAGVSISEEDGDVSGLQVSSNGLFLAVGTDCSRWRHVREKERQQELERAAVKAGEKVGLGKAGGERQERGGDLDGEKEETARGQGGEGGEAGEADRGSERQEGGGGNGEGGKMVAGAGDALADWRDTDEGGSRKERGSAVSLLDLFSLKALCRFKLPEGTDVTALALSADNTNLLCSTSADLAPGQLILYSNPLLSVKMVDQMLRLGWEGSEFASIF
ncbi:hypothetical protein CLOM_g6504 [Closterium sp. NIES-68]|nr:hypothetical protein CLOM_g6504 [Closterium sp. NIES-68]